MEPRNLSAPEPEGLLFTDLKKEPRHRAMEVENMEQQRTLIEVVGEDELIIHEDLGGEETQEPPGLEDLLYEEWRDQEPQWNAKQ